MTGANSLIFSSDPGVILGPYESLAADLLWMGDAYRAGLFKESPIEDLRKAFTVNSSLRRQILDAYILHGRMDTLAGMGLVDMAVSSRSKYPYSRREIVGDLIGSRVPSPFCHSLEVGHLMHLGFDPFPPAIEDRRALSKACVRGLARAGLRGVQEWGDTTVLQPKQAVQRVFDDVDATARLGPEYRSASFFSVAGKVLLGTIAAIDRSIVCGCPFLSKDVAGPAWASSTRDHGIQILKLVYEEVLWLPQPKTFMEAISMNSDERVNDLRQSIRVLIEKTLVGDLATQTEVRAEIRKQVAWFKRKPWAARLGRMIAYGALPAEIVGLLVEQHAVGPIVAAVGLVTEWMATRIEKGKHKSWLSIETDDH